MPLPYLSAGDIPLENWGDYALNDSVTFTLHSFICGNRVAKATWNL